MELQRDVESDRAAAGPRRDRASRVAQEATDAFERSRVGGLYFVAVWILICVTAGQHGRREWAIGAGFLLLAGARLAVKRLRRLHPGDHALQLGVTLGVMITTMAAWGGVTAFALLHPDYVATPTVILFATSAFTTAYVHSYPMRLWPAVAGLSAGYGPPFAVLVAANTPGAAAIATGVFIHYSYLLLAARRAHYEYHRSIDLEEELRAQRDLFSRRSRIDGLTGLANRREFNERLALALADARASGAPLALMIVDLDHFKLVNDRRGHAAGDQCLVAVAERLRASFPAPGALPARLGGEEFAVVMPGSTRSAAYALARAFRSMIASQPLATDDGAVALTVSVGVGDYRADVHRDPDALYRAVDAALYRAKREGRNRVCEIASADPVPDPAPELPLS